VPGNYTRVENSLVVITSLRKFIISSNLVHFSGKNEINIVTND